MSRPTSGRKGLKIALIIIIVVSVGVALSYPILDKLAQMSNEGEISELSALRRQRLEELASETTPPNDEPTSTTVVQTQEPMVVPTEAPTSTAEAAPSASPETTVQVLPEITAETVPLTTDGEMHSDAPEETALVITDIMALILDPPETPTPSATISPTPRPTLSASPAPTQTPDRHLRTGAPSYDSLEKIVFDEKAILPELREIYELNHDLIGWLMIPGTDIDYPVVQTQDTKFYLDHDFYGKENVNGQIILDPKCDPFTPSYNLVISGHRMNSGAMFGNLNAYAKQEYWAQHKTIEFDSLMQRRRYVIFGVFYSADYDEHEEGFRYNADIRYKIDADNWLAEVAENQIYDTGVDVQFGDEFLTLTTCVKTSYNGRFVVVARKIREEEIIR